MLYQIEQDRPAGVRVQVQGDELVFPGLHWPPQRLTLAPGMPPFAQRIRAARILDLMTSVPKSASNRPAKGPAIKVPISRTRTPVNGRSVFRSGRFGGDALRPASLPNPGSAGIGLENGWWWRCRPGVLARCV